MTSFVTKQIKDLKVSSDWWTVYVGVLLFCAASIAVGAGYQPMFAKASAHLLPGNWSDRPFTSFTEWPAFIVLVCVCIIAPGFALAWIKGIKSCERDAQFSWRHHLCDFSAAYIVGIVAINILTLISLLLGQQDDIRQTGFETTVWAFLIGLLISNCLVPSFRILHTGGNYAGAMMKGLPRPLHASSHGEWYIKIGLVALGIDFQTIGSLGLPGILSSWIDTPIVLIVSFMFGIFVLKMNSPDDRKLAIVLSAGLAVCGSSASTAIISVIGGSDELLVFVVAILTIFTTAQMLFLPLLARSFKVNDFVIGAWLGGAMDQTGSVVVAAELYGGENTVETAGLVKIIQNAAIGFIAIGVAIYWIRYEKGSSEDEEPLLEPGSGTRRRGGVQKVSMLQLWERFPKFVLGFLLLSCFLTVARSISSAETVTVLKSIVMSISKWFFTVGFVCTGLETNFHRLFSLMRNVWKVVALYLFGQLCDLLLGFLMAYIAFKDHAVPEDRK